MAESPKSENQSPIAGKLPEPPVERWTRPLAQFLRVESAAGIVLLACALLALILANSPAAAWYHAFWHTPVTLQFGTWSHSSDLAHFVINDGLMTIFFFVVGLEIKRELVAGELSEVRKAALPVLAAVGGMLVPAAAYMALRWGEPDFRGWAVPMATDIAFVVGVLALLGRRAPFGLKITLLSLAIVDDIGAVLVIAAFYSTNLSWAAIGAAGAGLVLIYILNRIGVRPVPVYIIAGIGVWLAILESGIHPTVAGVVLGLMTPSGTWVRRESLRLALVDLLADLRTQRDDYVDAHDLQLLSFAAKESVSPLERLEHFLHPWAGFAIMPLFALANAGVHVELGEIAEPVALAVALGLVFGKPAGVILFSFIAVKAGIASLPEGVSWRALFGGGCLAGIGFTMSLFIAGLAFEEDQLLAHAKIGILTGSILSAIAGSAILLTAVKSKR